MSEFCNLTVPLALPASDVAASAGNRANLDERGVTDEDFEADTAAVQRDPEAVRAVLEHRTDRSVD